MRYDCCLLVFVLLPLSSCTGREQAPQQVPPVPYEQLLASLPEPWNTPRVQPPDEENGYLRFRAAVTEDQGAVPRIVWSLDDLSEEQTIELVAEFAPWIDELEACLAMPAWSAPLPDDGAATPFPELAILKSVQKGLHLSATYQSGLGNQDEAVRLLLIADRLADRQAMAGGSLIHFLVGLAVDAIARRAASEVIAGGGLKQEHLAALMDAVEGPDFVAGLRRAAIDEVQGFTVFETARLAFPDQNLSNLFDDPLLGIQEESRKKGKERIRALFEGHKDPFDHFETVMIYVEVWDEILDSLDREFLPGHVTNLLASRIGPWEDIKIEELLSIGDWPDDQFIRLKAEVEQTSNAYGRHLAGIMLSVLDKIVDTIFLARTRRELYRAQVGSELFSRQYGRLPYGLDELVAKGFLERAPMDWFANAPLRYDADRRLVWSVGPDGVDDGGEDEPFMFKGKDRVWPL